LSCAIISAMEMIKRKTFWIFLSLFLISFVFTAELFFPGRLFGAASSPKKETAANTQPQEKPKDTAAPNTYQEYIDFFEKVYKTVENDYYFPVKREAFDRFLVQFNTKIYGQLKGEDKTSDYIRWRSAALLVDALKDPEDSFSAFMPPKYADKYEKEVLGEQIDLGIEGKLTDGGYLVTRVEPRADAYVQGLREKDIILAIDDVVVTKLAEDAIGQKFNPLVGTKVGLRYLANEDQKERNITVVSQQYFKQSVFPEPVDVPGVFCLQIRHFNQKTSEDLLRFLQVIERYPGSALILDLRGNPGGPPLAAQEISGFFLTPTEDFAYFQKKEEKIARLQVPLIPEKYHYKGPIAILVDKESGSSSELFSGVLQKRGRAVLIGTNTAGKVLLKSMFHFDDGSMLLLVTARGHFYDGAVFDFNGLTPDKPVEDSQADLVHFAAIYLKGQVLNPNLGVR